MEKLLTLLFLTLTQIISPAQKVIPTPGVIAQAIVTRVVDGDTVVLKNGQKVRYVGIDTPEHDECYFDAATIANRNLVLNKKVKLVKDVSETDKYGRLLRYVYVGKTFVNRYLVRQGLAQVATYPPDVAYVDIFRQAQSEARNYNRGFWGAEGCIEEIN